MKAPTETHLATIAAPFAGGPADEPASGPSPRPGLTSARMYERMLACDVAYDGVFFTGVLTTGIYCLPSCRARKPRPENVLFFRTAEEARNFGLRPCRKCHPDDFARGSDPVLETIEELVAELRAQPARFPDVAALVRRSGFGATRLFQLCRLHYHATPADLLSRARLATARRLLAEDSRGIAEIALEAGFEALSTFHERFRLQEGLTPGGYRRLADPDTTSFTLELPGDYAGPEMRRALGRDPESATERLEGDSYTAAVRLNDRPSLVRLEFRGQEVRACVPAGTARAAHRWLVRLLGLGQDAAGFARHAHKLDLGRLVAGREGLRLCQTHSVFAGLVRAIAGQQVSLAFAFQLERRLARAFGEPAGEGLHCPPAPEALARLPVEKLTGLQFSRAKANYLLGVARAAAGASPDLEALRELSATRAERRLRAVHGLGPWSVAYVLLRSLGWADCVPLGDTGLTSGLQRLFRLGERPDADATRRLMEPFSPYRSLATAHLWLYERSI